MKIILSLLMAAAMLVTAKAQSPEYFLSTNLISSSVQSLSNQVVEFTAQAVTLRSGGTGIGVEIIASNNAALTNNGTITVGFATSMDGTTWSTSNAFVLLPVNIESNRVVTRWHTNIPASRIGSVRAIRATNVLNASGMTNRISSIKFSQSVR